MIIPLFLPDYPWSIAARLINENTIKRVARLYLAGRRECGLFINYVNLYEEVFTIGNKQNG